MAAVHHLGFVKFEISTASPVGRANMRHHAKYRADRSNAEISRCIIFQDGGCRHLGFFFKILVETAKNVELRHWAKFR